MRPSNDREAMTLILDGIEKRGCKVRQVQQDSWNPEELDDVETVKEAVDLVMEVDEAVVFVDLPGGDASTWIFFVLGNSPEEVACDHGVSLSEYIDPITRCWWE